jgi:hypothetical protein
MSCGSVVTGTPRSLVCATDNATREQLSTLLQQIPMFLQSKNIGSDWLDPVVAGAVSEYPDASDDQTLAHKANDVVAFNRNLLQKRVTQTTNPNAYRRPNYVPISAVH